jgi:hypothetical protein
LISANDIVEKIQSWLGDLRLRRMVFSIWLHGKIAMASPHSQNPLSLP